MSASKGGREEGCTCSWFLVFPQVLEAVGRKDLWKNGAPPGRAGVRGTSHGSVPRDCHPVGARSRRELGTIRRAPAGGGRPKSAPSSAGCDPPPVSVTRVY